MNPGALRKAVTVAVLMVLAGGLALAAKPRVKVAELGPKVDLEAMIPRAFGEWMVDERVIPVIPSPEAQAKLSRIYDQTLARTYVNPRGERVMLSIAYGGDQSDAMQVHKPEVCYPAQGFSVSDVVGGEIGTQAGPIPVKRLVAQHGVRVEPISYWITVGNRTSSSGFGRKLIQLSYGLTGRIPDGLLFRVSSIDIDDQRAYDLQERFIEALLSAVSPAARVRLAGR